jgi:enterochelin esterase family protein
MGRATMIMDNLIASGRAVPMIVVIANGNAKQSVSQGFGYGPTPSLTQVTAPAPNAAPTTPNGQTLGMPPIPYEGSHPESVVKDVIPFVEKTYRVYADKEHRAIAGLSMDGTQTVVVTTNNPSTFSYIGVFSSGGRVGDPKFEAQIEQIKQDGISFIGPAPAISIRHMTGW